MDLSKYKDLLDQGTNEGLRDVKPELSRYQSFKYCIDYLSSIENPSILELGTTRSFVDGKYEGCNSANTKYWDKDNFSKWDFGGGCFTLLFGQLGYDFTTLDLISSHIDRSKFMTDSLGIKCTHVVSDSCEFLRNTNKKFDLIYVDTCDMMPIIPTENVQLEECKIIVERELLKPNGLLLIDDVLNLTPREHGYLDNKYGKSTKSLPFLLQNEFKVVFEGYQYILKK